MCPKLTEREARDYWTSLHETVEDDLAAVIFPDRSRLFNRFFDSIQRTAISHVLTASDLPMRGVAALDVGCGRGRWLRYFRELGASPQGVDVSARAVEICRQAGFAVREEGVESLSHADESFDFVSAITVLLHIPPESQTVAAREIARVCRPGGHVLLLEPTRRDDNASHVWPRELDDWLGLFPDFDVVRVDGHYFAPLLRLLWASRALAAFPSPLRGWVEDFVVLWSWPLELALMRVLASRRSRVALQHVVLLAKRPGENRAGAEAAAVPAG